MIDRLSGEEEPKIGGHLFYSVMVALSEAQVTRTQSENLLSISDTGTDATQLTALIQSYTRAADKSRWFRSLDAIVNMVEHRDFTLSASQIMSWLAAAEA